MNSTAAIEVGKTLLNGTKKKVFQFFQLQLRVGIYPNSVEKNRNKKFYIGKWKFSKHYNQAILLGEGVEYVENLIKMKNSEYAKHNF